jgi:hypothetical protein
MRATCEKILNNFIKVSTEQCYTEVDVREIGCVCTHVDRVQLAQPKIKQETFLCLHVP